MVAVGHMLTVNGRVTVLASEFNPTGHVIVLCQADTGQQARICLYSPEEIRSLIALLEKAHATFD